MPRSIDLLGDEYGDVFAILLAQACRKGTADARGIGCGAREVDRIGRPIMTGAELCRQLGVTNYRVLHSKAFRQAYYAGWSHAKATEADAKEES